MTEIDKQSDMFEDKFLPGLDRSSSEIETLINNSGLSDDIKEKCREAIKNIKTTKATDALALKKIEVNSYSLSQHLIGDLMGILGSEDEKEKALFKELNTIISRLIDSEKF